VRLYEDTRDYLAVARDDFTDGDPVPVDEIVATGADTGHGWTEREVREALRASDRLEAADSPDHVRLVDGPADVDDREDDADGEDTVDDPDAPDASPGCETGEPASTPIETDESGPYRPDADPATADSYDAVSFDATVPDRWPAALLATPAWMLRKVGKSPWSPWTDPDAPVLCTPCSEDHDSRDGDSAVRCSECDHSARYKWGPKGALDESREHVHTDAATALDWRDKHPQARDDLVFIQSPDDPFAFVDLDDVRCPETGAVHPAAIDVLDALGVTYTDVSTSGTGLHAYYRGTLPDGVKQAVWELDSEAWGANDDDDLPAVEIYDGKHVCIATGRHLSGTGTRVEPWDDAALRDLLDAHDLLPSDDAPSAADREAFDPVDYDADATTSDETTGDARDVFAALDRLDARRVAARTIVSSWNDDANTTGDYRAFAPTWGPNANGTANIVDREKWQDTGGTGYGGPAVMAAIDAGLVDERAQSSDVDGETWVKAIDHLRSLGFDVPEYDPTHGADADASDRHPRVVECPPPADDLEPADVDAIRDRIRGPVYDDYVARDDAPTVLAHAPGAGKTTTSHLAAADRDRPLAFLFDKHRKAHEHRADDVTPDVDLHLRGAPQPRDDACARAAYEGEPCDEHGDPSQCPRMCPVYDLDAAHPDRERFQAVAAEVGPVRAHLILEPHDGDGCAWLDALQDAPTADSLVGVHQYQRLKTVTAPDDDPRDVLVDESPGDLADNRRLDVAALTRLSNSLAEWSGRTAAAETLRRVGRFAAAVRDAVVDGDDLADLDAPAPVWDAYESYDAAAGNYMEYAPPDDGEPWQATEALVRAKRAFLDHHLAALRDDEREWDGTPLAFDALLAAAAAAGLDEDVARGAAGHPFALDACPQCGATDDFGHTDGRRVCGRCEWDEGTDLYTAGDHDPARILAWVEHDHDVHGGDAPGLVRRRLPTPTDLPDDPLVLDATATPSKIAALYGVPEDDVAVHGAGQHALDGLHLTQITDGQYHHSTLANAVENDHASARRIQTHLDRVGELHDRPLVVGRQDVTDLFDLPENARFVHFHGARGLNFDQCDAVVVVGAPHPDMNDLRRRARLLAQGREDVRVGGVEHSPRDDCPNPPVYRKLRHTDDDGRGRAVATKHYTGLVGALFREAREKELEQVVHRIRPLLADVDDPKHAYLLTNVPTDLPVDEVCSLEELTETPAAMLPVADGALTLADTLADVAAGASPDGFRAGALVERDGEGSVRFRIREVHRLARATGQDVAERTVRRWVDDLRDLGLVDAGDYVAREGVPYSADAATLTRALSVLTDSAGVEVAVKRRLAALATELDSAAAWIRRARGLVDLAGAADGEPPPLNGGGPAANGPD
jgi:hypothetical protein